MDMLTEREVIRNEALLLLVALTRANEEVQKIAAFEGAFDRCGLACNGSCYREGCSCTGCCIRNHLDRPGLHL